MAMIPRKPQRNNNTRTFFRRPVQKYKGERPKKVLFVCHGNICRSPAAEGIMRAIIAKNGFAEKIEVDSAGCHNYHEGESPDPRMIKAAAARGYALTHKARKIRTPDFGIFDKIIIMDDQNIDELRYLDRTNKYAHKITYMLDYAKKTAEREVPDPWYGTMKDFEYVLDLLEDACQGLLDKIKQELEEKKTLPPLF